jgi:dienelactone hydrolase
MDEPGRIGAEFDAASFTYQGRSHEVFRAGSGPGVVVIHEVPGLHPGVVEFGRRLIGAGFTVYLPSLFGRPGEAASTGAVVRSILGVCIAREFSILADRTSRIARWLRALAVKAHAECGGAGVGAVGMCLTGGFALAMAVEPAVLASVVSQPALPAPLNVRKRAALGLDPGDLASISDRTRHGLCVLGASVQPRPRMPRRTVRDDADHSGPRFESIEIDSSPGNPFAIPSRAHAVLTVDLVDEPGHPTRAALDRVLFILNQQLRPSDRIDHG